MRTYLLLSSLLLVHSSFAQDPLIREQIQAGVVWEYYHFNTDSTSQSITHLEINPGVVSVAVVAVDHLIPTSQIAKDNDAIAAVNGSFFDMKNGGAAVFLQLDKVIMKKANENKRFSSEGALAIGKKGIDILARPEKNWKKLRRYEDVLVAGPLLRVNNQNVVAGDGSFHTNRHPRTAVCTLTNDHLLLVVVDGRSSSAHGMNLFELSEWMAAQGCVDALNLDGGGSSTAFIKGRTDTGVVNYPSDNKTFDHNGERPVANVIIIR